MRTIGISQDTITVLNVDDDEPGRYAVSRILQRAGFAVREAATGAEALRLAAELPDLVLLDVHLPDIDGLEVCRRIKADPGTAAIPVVHLSATSRLTADRVIALENGAEGYLFEPVDPDELVATVQAMVRLRRLHDRLRRLQATTASLSKANTAEAVARVILEQGLSALGAAAGSVALATDGELVVLDTVGYPAEVVERWRHFSLSAPVPMAEAALFARPVWLPSPEAFAKHYPHLAHSPDRLGYAAAAAIPLIVSDRVVGALGLSFVEPLEFGPDDEAFILNVASQCAQALERARLYEVEQHVRAELEARVEQRTAELRQEMAQRRLAQQQLEHGREAERARIARELHDQLGSGLTVLKIGLRKLARQIPDPPPAVQQSVEQLTGEIDDLVESVRQITTELRPVVLDDFGLLAALEWQFQEFTRRTGLKGVYQCSASELPVAPEATVPCFRIVQEALTNIARHAQATEAQLSVAVEDGLAVITVRDNGQGMSPEAQDRPGHHGLAGMRERAHLIQADLVINSAPGQGTTITIKAPLTPPGSETSGNN